MEPKIINTTKISPSVKTITVKFDYTKENKKMINEIGGTKDRRPCGGKELESDGRVIIWCKGSSTDGKKEMAALLWSIAILE